MKHYICYKCYNLYTNKMKYTKYMNTKILCLKSIKNESSIQIIESNEIINNRKNSQKRIFMLLLFLNIYNNF